MMCRQNRLFLIQISKKVFVIPATIQLAGAEIELVSAIARETRLKDLLEPIQDEFDFYFH